MYEIPPLLRQLFLFPLVGTAASGKDALDQFKKAKRPLTPFSEQKFLLDIPKAFNKHGMLGIRTGLMSLGATRGGYNLGVIDLDYDKGGKNGRILLSLPETASVKTPHGEHLYYRVPDGQKFRSDNTGKLGQGIDSRGEGGYVVSPFSSLGKFTYVINPDWPQNFADLPLMPDHIMDKLRYIPKERGVEDRYFDDEDTIKECITRLLSMESSQTGTRSDTVYKISCAFKNLGLREEKTLELMKTYANESLLGIGETRLKETISNAYKYSNKPAGVYNPKAIDEYKEIEFSPQAETEETGGVSEGSEEKKEGKREEAGPADPLAKHRIAASRWQLQNAVDAKTKEQRWIVDGLIPENALAFLYGAPGAGKSFIAVDLAQRVAVGAQWCGRRVDKSSVLYLACEARSSFGNRLLAARMRPGSGVTPDNLWYYPHPVSLGNGRPDTVTLMSTLILNPEIKLVIIDTVARSIAGDENDNMQVASYLNALQQVVNECKVSVLFVHHSGKDASKGMRGSSNFTGFAETVIAATPVYGEDDRGVTGHVLVIEKQAEGLRLPNIAYQLKAVTIGQGEYGPITSCYVDYSSDDPMTRALEELPTLLLELEGEEGDVDASGVSALVL